MQDGDDQYFIQDRGKVTGPFDFDTLTRFVRTRRLARHHLVSRDRTTWTQAIRAVPGAFPATSSPGAAGPPALEPIADARDAVPESEPPLIPGTTVWRDAPPGRHGDRASQTLYVVVLSLAGLCLVTVVTLVTLALWKRKPVSHEDVAACVVIIQGNHPTDGSKRRLLGLVTSKSQVVAPFEAATLHGLKVRKGDEEEWRTAYLLIPDPQAGIALLGAALPKKTRILEIPDKPVMPQQGARLDAIGPLDDVEDMTLRCKLKEIVNPHDPEERMRVSLEEASPDEERVVGRALVDSNGRFVGIVGAMEKQRSLVCTSAREVAVKREEGRGLSAAHARPPVSPPQPPPTQPPPTQPPPTPAPPTPAPPTPAPPTPAPPTPAPPTPAPPTPASATPAPATPETPEPASPTTSSGDGKPADSSPADSSPADSSPVGLIEAVGRAGATVVAGATDSLTSKLDPETARKLGDEHLEDELSEHPRCRDGRLVGRITRLWNEVARAAAVDPASCTVTVTEDETVNVYAFVGRNVVFTTGFANFAGGDDEMICFVLAHELGHIELGHTDLPYRRAEAAGTIGPLGQLSHMAAERIAKDSPMNQSQEYDADCYAARTVRKAGRSTEGAVRFFNRIEQERPSGGSGDTLLGALFGSHPDSARRIDHVRTGCP